MAINKLYFGHRLSSFVQFDSTLLTIDNFLDSKKTWKSTDYHTSSADLGFNDLDQIIDLLKNVSEVIFVDLERIVVEPDRIGLMICYQLLTNYKHLFKGDPQDLRQILVSHQFNHPSRPVITKEKKLWVAGCSVSSNAPYPNEYVKPSERWGHIVSRELGYTEMILAEPGYSIYDSTRSIIEADIDPSTDILIWQLTTLPRIDLINREGIYKAIWDPELIKNLGLPKKYTDSDHLILGALIDLHLGIIYCKKMKIDLYVWNLGADNEWIIPFFRYHNDTKFLNLQHFYENGPIDFGTDGLHPGPKQNKEYAKEIIKFVRGEKE